MQDSVNEPIKVMLEIPESVNCAYDVISLGEVMLRLDPGDRPIVAARIFEPWEGGGEYNVARAASAVFGLRTAHVTALVDNEIGRLIERLMRESGVDTRFIRWVDFDGIGKAYRNPLNFTERGFGVRSGVGVSDRAYSPASQLNIEKYNLDEIFFQEGTRWFHTGGIFAGLSEQSAELLTTAIVKAREAGAVVSYDLNYRASLFAQKGGKEAARNLNLKIAEMVDVLVGNEEDYYDCLGINLTRIRKIDETTNWNGFEEILLEVRDRFPSIRASLITLRRVKSASRNDWSAIGIDQSGLYKGRMLNDLEIYDRIGGGDGFISGFISAALNGENFGMAIEQGIAHGALVMTTPGDGSMATKAQVERLVAGKTARVVR